MRMWMVDVATMCLKHLLGEHAETHMILGCLRNGSSLQGYYTKGLVELTSLVARHNQLAAEIEKRGYCHRSPLNLTWFPPVTLPKSGGTVDPVKSLAELHRRCVTCKSRYEVNLQPTESNLLE